MADQKVREMEPVETQIVEIMPPDVENLIYVVRNKQVILCIRNWQGSIQKYRLPCCLIM